MALARDLAAEGRSCKLLADCCGGLLEEGWAVVDGLLGQEWAKALSQDCEALEKSGLLAQHSFEFTNDGKVQTYHHDGRWYADLDATRVREGVADRAQHLASFATLTAPALCSTLTEALPMLDLCRDAAGLQVKLQLTTGTFGCAPCHYDTSDTAASRQLTLLLYLSEGWTADDGAELLLQPFLQAPSLLVPAFDRGVLFMADRMLHRSLPPSGPGLDKPRWLLTVWFDGCAVDSAFGSRLPPELQRGLAPALYREDYIDALEQSLPPGEARKALLEAQQREIESLEEDDELADMIEGLRGVVEEQQQRMRQALPEEVELLDDEDTFELRQRLKMAGQQQVVVEEDTVLKRPCPEQADVECKRSRGAEDP